jgi:hypothetical protein
MARHMDWGVFKKGMILDDDLHGERCNRLFIRMNKCNKFFNYNLWFKVDQDGMGTFVVLDQLQ